MPKFSMDHEMYEHFAVLLCQQHEVNIEEILYEFSQITKKPFEEFRKNKKQVRTLCGLVILAYTSNTIEFVKSIVEYGYTHPNILASFRDILSLMFPFEKYRSDFDKKDRNFQDMVMWIITTFQSLPEMRCVYEHILVLRSSLFFVLEKHNISHILKPAFLVEIINVANKNDAAIEYARGVISRLGINHPAVVRGLLTRHMVQMCIFETNIRFLRMLHDEFNVKIDQLIPQELIQHYLDILAYNNHKSRENLYETIWFFRSINIHFADFYLLQEAAEFYKTKFLYFVMKTEYKHNLCEDVLYLIGSMI